MRKRLKEGDLITIELLAVNHACGQQLGRFRTVFPKGMKFNTRNLNKARTEYRLNTMWFLVKFFRSEYGKALEILGINPYNVRKTKKQARAIHSTVMGLLRT